MAVLAQIHRYTIAAHARGRAAAVAHAHPLPIYRRNHGRMAILAQIHRYTIAARTKPLRGGVGGA